MVWEAPIFKKKNRRGADSESAIIHYKSAIPDPKSTIQTEEVVIPLCVVEPNPDSLVINVDGVITSGLDSNK